MYAIACILSFDGLSKPSVPTVDMEPVASAVDATGLGDDPNTTMGESLFSNLADGNELLDLVTAPTEADSAVKEPEKKRSRSKKHKSANMDSVNMGADLSTASDEAASAVEEPVKKRRRSKKRRSAKNSDVANEQPELKPANESDMGNMEESLPSNLVNGNEQLDTNTALAEAASAGDEPEKKRSRSSKKRKSAKNLDLGNMEAKETFDLANNGNDQTELKSASKEKEIILANLTNGDEQPDPQMESASAASEPEKKQSRSKRRKLANSSSSGNNTEENVPSTNNGNELISSGLTEAA